MKPDSSRYTANEGKDVMFIVLLGPPGSGKGTQAKSIEKTFGFSHISTGDMLREAIHQPTELGRQARGYMDAGKLVPDEIMVSIVENRLGRKRGQESFVLDGFPRTVNQAQQLDDFLKIENRSISGSAPSSNSFIME